jgi:hypothetical protein
MATAPVLSFVLHHNPQLSAPLVEDTMHCQFGGLSNDPSYGDQADLDAQDGESRSQDIQYSSLEMTISTKHSLVIFFLMCAKTGLIQKDFSVFLEEKIWKW